jgi:cytochrome P450
LDLTFSFIRSFILSTDILRLPVADESLLDTYARFRDSGPVVQVELPGGVRAWAVTTHAAVREVLTGDDKMFGKHSSHWAALQDGAVPADWPLLPLVLGEHMLVQDGAAHRRLRGLLSSAFTPSRVEALRPRVRQITDELCDSVATRGAHGDAVDLIPVFADQLPMAVICELFGVPGPDRAQLRGWTQALFSHLNTAEETHAAQQNLVGYLTSLLEEKRRNPGEDLTTALVQGHDDDNKLSAQELVDCLFLLIVAGNETTVHLLGHAIVGLLTNPDQLALAAAEDRWTDVVEEALRRTPPVAGAIFRYALEPMELAGVPIAAGDPLLLCIGGAATDPEHHGADADRFDITREQQGHLAFGHGPHFCLGAPLARLEGEIALRALFTRLPDMRLAIASSDIPYSPSFLTYGPLSLPVFTGTPR